MTQRKIERVAGWAAFVSWCAFAALFAFVFYLAAAAPDSVQPQHVAVKHQAKPDAAVAGPAAGRSDKLIAAQVFMFPTAIVFFVACGLSSWWRWRRRMRVAAETYVEARAVARLDLPRRNGRSTAI